MENNKNGKKSPTSKRGSKASSKKHHKKKKDMGIIPYLTTPLIYVLISLIAVLPLFIGFANMSIKAVHNIQDNVAIDYNDRVVYSDRYDNKSLVYESGKIGICEKVGVIKCEKVGIVEDVFYGVNRVSLRNGAAMSVESNIDSYKSKLYLAGYSSRAFKGVNNLSVGDVITVEMCDKTYQYTVESNEISETAPAFERGLLLSCDVNSKAFSAYSRKKRFVYASFTSMENNKGE